MGFNTDFQKEIWLKHIEVQERVLQVNSAPIIIEPDSIQIFGKRMHLKVCQTDEIDAKINSIKAFFNISDDDIDYVNNTFICNNSFVADIDEILRLAEECQKYYIQLSKNPIIDGVIRSQKSTFSKFVKVLKELNEQYAVDNNGRLQVTVEALRKLDNDSSLSEDALPDKASGIFGVSPTPAYFLRKWLSIDCTHKLKYEMVKVNDVEERRLRRMLSLNDNYLNESSLQKLNQLWGLRFLSFDVAIEVSKDILKHYDKSKSLYDFSDPKEGVFCYHFNVKSPEKQDNVSIIDSKWQIDLLRNIFNTEFGENSYNLHIKFNYIYDNKMFRQFTDGINNYEFFQELKSTIQDERISISESKQSIGVDFDWRQESPDDLRIELSNMYDDMEISIFSGHKCNVEICDKNADWEKIENFLKQNYSSLKTFISSKDGSMHFYQEYRTQEQASQFSYSLSSSLRQLNTMGCECEL